MREEVADFLHYCRIERRLSEMICKAYERDVSACMRFLQADGITDWAGVRPPELRRFLADEAVRRPAPSSQARSVAALKCFFRFCVENEYLDRDPALVLRTPKKREALPDVLDRRELARLLRVVDRDDVWQRHFRGRRERDKLMLALFAYAGLRHSELLGLDWEDVDLERRLLRVRKAKGGRQRNVPIHPALVPLFIDYIAIRAGDSEPALFVGVQGRQATQLDAAQAGLRPIRRSQRRQRAKTSNATYPASRLRVRAPRWGRQPAPDPGTPRPQASRLDSAVRACHRTWASRRSQTAPMERIGPFAALT